MTLDQLTPWLTFAALFISVASPIITALTSGSKKNGERIDTLDGRVDDLDRRIQATESTLAHLPNKDAVHRLELALMELKGEVIKIGASSEQSARTAARVETYLLEHGK